MSQEWVEGGVGGIGGFKEWGSAVEPVEGGDEPREVGGFEEGVNGVEAGVGEVVDEGGGVVKELTELKEEGFLCGGEVVDLARGVEGYF